MTKMDKKRLLNFASLKVISGTILRPSDTGAFKLLLKAELTNSGPLPVLIRYKQLLNLARQVPNKRKGLLQDIATVKMKSATSVPSWGGQVDMDSTVMISYDNLDDFAQFSKDLVSSKGQVNQVLYGDGLSVELLGGLLVVEGLQIRKQVSLQGLEGLSSVTVHSAKVIGSTSEFMVLECDTSIYNPSNVSLEQLGDVFCSLHYVDQEQFSVANVQDMGLTQPHATILMENLTLKQGANRFMTRAHFKVTSSPGVERDSALKMLSNFICCKETKPVLIRGHKRKATKIPYLFESLTSLSISTSMPGLPSEMKMIKSALLLLHSPLSTLTSLTAPSRLELLNAFPVPVQILKMKGKILHRGNEIAALDVDLETTAAPLVLAPCCVSWTREIKLKLKVAVPAIMALFDFDTREGVLRVDVESILDCKVGDYLVRGVAYTQEGVCSKLGLV